VHQHVLEWVDVTVAIGSPHLRLVTVVAVAVAEGDGGDVQVQVVVVVLDGVQQRQDGPGLLGLLIAGGWCGSCASCVCLEVAGLAEGQQADAGYPESGTKYCKLVQVLIAWQKGSGKVKVKKCNTRAALPVQPSVCGTERFGKAGEG
jgi:hypothetical protein